MTKIITPAGRVVADVAKVRNPAQPGVWMYGTVDGVAFRHHAMWSDGDILHGFKVAITLRVMSGTPRDPRKPRSAQLQEVMSE